MDRYLTVPLHPEDKKFFKILWGEGGGVYEFQCLAFGLSSTPSILKLIVTFLRKHGLRLIIYFDDILILKSSAEETMTRQRGIMYLRYLSWKIVVFYWNFCWLLTV